MKTLIVYYSWSGHSKQKALATSAGGDIAEIKDVRRPGLLSAYTKGSYAAMKGKPWDIRPLGVDLSAYDSIVLYSPVWANNPPPAINAFLQRLPSGKSVTVCMVSASGKSNCRSRVEAAIKMKGSTLTGFEDIKG